MLLLVKNLIAIKLVMSILFAISQSQSLNKVGIIRAPKANEPVIVVGGGLAGLSASLQAFSDGANIVIFEKSDSFGGNSAKASSGVSACNTNIQKSLGINDSIEKFYFDTLTAGDRANDASLVDILVHESADAINFLMQYGVNLTDVNLCGGHSVPRLHWVPPLKEGKAIPVGMSIIHALKSELYMLKEKYPERIDIRLSTPVVGLVTWNDFVTGVRYKNSGGEVEELSGKSVILTTGGFSNDHDNESSLLSEFASERIRNLPSTNGPFATGDGIKMARAMGAAVIGMQDIQIHPTSFVDLKNPTDHSKFLAAEALRGKGAILLNERGLRFGNELGRRDYLSQQIEKNCAKNDITNGWHVAFMLVNDEIIETFGRSAFNFYEKIKGFFTLSEYMHCDMETLKSTLLSYNRHVKNDKEISVTKDEFGKTVFPSAFQLDEPFYVAIITPAIHYTMGGLKIDRDAFVFSEIMDRPFKGLLAAGEVSGGVHGHNRLAGNSLLECIVFGKIAGRSAARVSYSHDEL